MHFKVNLFIYLCPFSLFLISSISGELPDHDDIRNLLLNPNNNGTDRLTYQQLQLYFERKTGLSSTTAATQPRLFPLCVSTSTLENSKDPRLASYASMWRVIDKAHTCEDRPLRFYEFNESEHSMLGNRKWIKDITFSRINTADLDTRNMRQWMHIQVKPAKKLKGLYLQTIVGNMGLPSGEFTYEFGCSDLYPGHNDTQVSFALIQPCDYRSRSDLNVRIYLCCMHKFFKVFER